MGIFPPQRNRIISVDQLGEAGITTLVNPDLENHAARRKIGFLHKQTKHAPFLSLHVHRTKKEALATAS